MSDEPVKFILGDTAISALEPSPAEPRRWFGRRRFSRPPFSHCENCGAELKGHFCWQCGQPAVDYRRSFRHVIVDVLDSFLSWDSKIFATLGLLMVRPWQLTNQFIAGKRIRYLHPLRLYLLASIVFFFVVNYWAKSVHLDTSKMSPEQRAELETELQNDKDIPPAAKAKIRKALQKQGSSASTVSPEAEKGTESNQTPPNDSADQGEQKETKPTDYGPLLQFGPEKPGNKFEKWLQERFKQKIGEHGSNAQLFLISMINNLPYMMLCSIPFFAFVLKLLYIRKHIFYIDHLIYALHIHTFAYAATMLIGLITVGLNRTAPGVLAGWIIGLLWFGFATQIFLSIRRVYRQGWIKTFIKFWLGGVVYLVILIMGFVATVFITVAT
ncbi:MAG: hypothetical protein QOG67_3960 [Verrucomicrobiota bacterium]|jgi:hypothetical protein